MLIIETTKKRYSWLSMNPLLFLHKITKYYQDESGQEYEYSFWTIEDKTIQVQLKENELPESQHEYVMVVVDDVIQKTLNKKENLEQDEDEKVSIKIRIASTEEPNDWIHVINSFIYHSQQHDNKFAYIELLWFLCNNTWKKRILIQIIQQKYNDPYSISIITEGLKKIAICLSIEKQYMIKDTLEQFGVIYTIYKPAPIYQALSIIDPNNKLDKNHKSLFDLIDHILSIISDDNEVSQYLAKNSNNLFLHFLYWMSSPDVTYGNYETLGDIFSYLPTTMQLNLVKRYFHDIRKGATQLNLFLLKQFRQNKYANLSRYRHCIHTPSGRIDLTVSLLCDTLLTLLNTKGEKFQTFDGILDFAITNSNPTSPNIDFGLDMLFPLCDGGTVYNRNFTGFFTYQLLCRINEDKINNIDILTKTIKKILNLHTRKSSYYACSNNKEFPLNQNTIDKCTSLYTLKSSHGTTSCKCNNLVKVPYDNKWEIPTPSQPTDIFNLFFTNKEQAVAYFKQKECISLDDISIDSFKKNIKQLLKSLTNETFSDYYIIDGTKIDTDNEIIIDEFLIKERIRIIPCPDVTIGEIHDIFGILENITKSISPQNNKQQFQQIFYQKESEEIKRRVIKSLKEELKQDFNGEFFELPYNKQCLTNLIGLYYYKNAIHSKSKAQTDEKKFLVKESLGRFPKLCSPQLSDVHNPAIDLPYFWCMGKECFRNTLKNQTIDKEKEWRKYKLFHFAELIGTPKLHKTIAGYAPDESVRFYASMINKVLKKFDRLKCRVCGHLMFTEKNGTYNRHNYYSCMNPKCMEYKKMVYLNYCYNCKKELIDSRDSAQCPNGWYICPKCMSCCNDSQYERQAQRYILQHKTVPPRIEEKRGLGHNNKGIYFCPNCGTLLEKFIEHGEVMTGCPKCRKKIEKW